MDNKDNKRGFSGLSDLATEVSGIDKPIEHEPKQEARPATHKQPPQSQREAPASEPVQKATAASAFPPMDESNDVDKEFSYVTERQNLENEDRIKSAYEPLSCSIVFGALKGLLLAALSFIAVIFALIVVFTSLVDTSETSYTETTISNHNKVDTLQSTQNYDDNLDKIIDQILDKPQVIFTNAYITANTLNVRANPDGNGKIMGKLEKYVTLKVPTTFKDVKWVFVKKGSLEGYVASKYLEPGNGDEALYSECKKSVYRPESGHVFSRNGNGDHVIKIINSNSSDAIVKLKDRSGKAVLSFYVRRGSTSQIDNIPTGDYKLFYATGENYSNKCDVFLDGMSASASDTYDPYNTQYQDGFVYNTIYTYTLYKIADGNMRTRTIPIGSF